MAMVDRHCRAAAIVAERLRAETAIEAKNDVELNQIVVRFGAGRRPNAATA
jgi:glutamate/tyrosine decarboxylase-like PLP-dependent enzyme